MVTYGGIIGGIIGGGVGGVLIIETGGIGVDSRLNATNGGRVDGGGVTPIIVVACIIGLSFDSVSKESVSFFEFNGTTFLFPTFSTVILVDWSAVPLTNISFDIGTFS